MPYRCCHEKCKEISDYCESVGPSTCTGDTVLQILVIANTCSAIGMFPWCFSFCFVFVLLLFFFCFCFCFYQVVVLYPSYFQLADLVDHCVRVYSWAAGLCPCAIKREGSWVLKWQRIRVPVPCARCSWGYISFRVHVSSTWMLVNFVRHTSCMHVRHELHWERVTLQSKTIVPSLLTTAAHVQALGATC